MALLGSPIMLLLGCVSLRMGYGNERKAFETALTLAPGLFFNFPTKSDCAPATLAYGIVRYLMVSYGEGLTGT